MSNKAIGEITCPLCRSKKAKVSVSKAGLAVATCHRCHMQMFTRSDLSDAAMRGQIRPFEDAGQASTIQPEKPEAAPAQPVQPIPQQPSQPEREERPAWLKW